MVIEGPGDHVLRPRPRMDDRACRFQPDEKGLGKLDRTGMERQEDSVAASDAQGVSSYLLRQRSPIDFQDAGPPPVEKGSGDRLTENGRSVRIPAAQPRIDQVVAGGGYEVALSLPLPTARGAHVSDQPGFQQTLQVVVRSAGGNVQLTSDHGPGHGLSGQHAENFDPSLVGDRAQLVDGSHDVEVLDRLLIRRHLYQPLSQQWLVMFLNFLKLNVTHSNEIRCLSYLAEIDESRRESPATPASFACVVSFRWNRDTSICDFR
ncbi:MAG: hypothetical protein R3E12_13190 [Candidatus Eisenbacteria bacterium]